MDTDTQAGTSPSQRDGFLKRRVPSAIRTYWSERLLTSLDNGMVNFRMDTEIIGINNDSIHLLRSLSFQDALHIGLMTIIHGQSYFDNILPGTIP